MRYKLLILTLLFSTTVFAGENKLDWITFEEAVAASKKNPKLMLIDVYTDWCGWCKRMDNTTFKDSVMVKFLNDNFYCVKLNAEQKEDIKFGKDTMVYIQSGKKGVHELALRLLDGQLGYPAFVILGKKFNRIKIVKGYQKVQTFGPLLEKLWKENR